MNNNLLFVDFIDILMSFFVRLSGSNNVGESHVSGSDFLPP